AVLPPAYRAPRRFLPPLQWRCLGERWPLKAPPPLRGLPALFATYPDANVVMTHRDPTEVVASVTSLHVVLRRAFSRHVDPLRVGPEVAAMLADDIRCGVEARAARGAAAGGVGGGWGARAGGGAPPRRRREDPPAAPPCRSPTPRSARCAATPHPRRRTGRAGTSTRSPTSGSTPRGSARGTGSP